MVFFHSSIIGKSINIEVKEKIVDPKLIVIITISYLYGFFELFMNLRQKRKSKITSSNDKHSLWWLFGLIAIGYTLSYAIGATKIGRIYHWNALFIIGMILFTIGLATRIHSLLTLRQYFTYSVSKVENHQIIQTGLYRFIRHPGYLGQLIIFCGISISISNWLSILAMMIPVIFGYLNRMNIEEKFMAEQMGDEYLKYKARTKRIIPWIY
jgi:protein-S-isoprenylcysteine O-methyltransferase Ste14